MLNLPTVDLYALAWSATFCCIIISVQTATSSSLRDRPRLFTVVALFACSWVLVLGSYTTPAQGDSDAAQKMQYLAHLLSDVGSFLFIYIGGLLILEEQEHHQIASIYRRILHWELRWGLRLLYAIAVQKVITLPGPTAILVGSLTVHQASLVFSGLMSLAGYVSIGLGAFAICGRAFSAPLAFVVLSLVLYTVGEAARIADIWTRWKPFSGHFIMLFAVSKLMLTVAFCRIVTMHATVDGKTKA